MIVNEYDIRKIKMYFTMGIIRNKPQNYKIEMWGSGNIVTCKLEGQWFLPQAGVFFLKIRKLLGDHQTKFGKILSKRQY